MPTHPLSNQLPNLDPLRPRRPRKSSANSSFNSIRQIKKSPAPASPTIWSRQFHTPRPRSSRRVERTSAAPAHHAARRLPRMSVEGTIRNARLKSTSAAYGTKTHSIRPAAASRSLRSISRCEETATATSSATSAAILTICAATSHAPPPSGNTRVFESAGSVPSPCAARTTIRPVQRQRNTERSASRQLSQPSRVPPKLTSKLCRQFAPHPRKRMKHARCRCPPDLRAVNSRRKSRRRRPCRTHECFRIVCSSR